MRLFLRSRVFIVCLQNYRIVITNARERSYLRFLNDKLWYLLTSKIFDIAFLFSSSSMHQLSKHVSIHDKQDEASGNENLGLIMHSPLSSLCSKDYHVAKQ